MNIIEYLDKNGISPFQKWLKNLDMSIKYRIQARLLRIAETDNLGDVKPIKGTSNIYELRFSFGSGYRVYIGRKDQTLIILLVGGDKSTQSTDIDKAKKYWEDYNA